MSATLGVAPKRVRMAVVASAKGKKRRSGGGSRFFFDMLMAVDVEVVAEHIIPHLGDMEHGVRWMCDLIVHGEGAGLLRRSVMGSLLFPAMRARGPERMGPLSLKGLIGGMARSSPDLVRTPVLAATLVRSVLEQGISAGVSIDIAQCSSCVFLSKPLGPSSPPHPANCHGRISNPLGMTCMQYAEFIRAVLGKLGGTRVDRLSIGALDTNTYSGLSILWVLARMIRDNLRSGEGCGPRALEMSSITTHQSSVMVSVGLQQLCEIIKICMEGGCTEAQLCGFTVLGRPGAVYSEFLPACIVQSLAAGGIRRLLMRGACLYDPVLDQCEAAMVALSITSMRRGLCHLALGSERCPQSSAVRVLAAIAAHGDGALQSLEEVVIWFGTCTSTDGTLDLSAAHMALSPGVAPALRTVTLACSNSPFSFLQMRDFIKGMVGSRSKVGPRLDTVFVRGRYVALAMTPCLDKGIREISSRVVYVG